MYKQWNTILRQVSASTFEDLGFFLPDSEPSAEQLQARPQAAVQVDFEGAFQGRLLVKLFGDVLEPLATNMLAAEEPPSSALQRDALGEVANVICGNILPQIAGRTVVFTLASPAMFDLNSQQQDPAAAVTLGLDEGRAEIALFVRADSLTDLLSCQEPADLCAAPAAWPEEAA